MSIVVGVNAGFTLHRRLPGLKFTGVTPCSAASTTLGANPDSMKISEQTRKLKISHLRPADNVILFISAGRFQSLFIW